MSGFSLRWSQVDFEGKSIRLNNNVKTPGSAEGPIPLSQYACDVLQARKKEEASKSEYVFFCGVRRYVALGMRGRLGRRTEPPPMPHNSHQRSGSGEVPVWPDRQTLPNWVLSGLPVTRRMAEAC
jgi:hypothetical protein